MLSLTYEITTDELISPPYDIAIVTISYGRVTESPVWDTMMSKKNMGWPFYAAVLRKHVYLRVNTLRQHWNTNITPPEYYEHIFVSVHLDKSINFSTWKILQLPSRIYMMKDLKYVNSLKNYSTCFHTKQHTLRITKTDPFFQKYNCSCPFVCDQWSVSRCR